MRILLVAITILFLGLFLFLPLAAVLAEAFRKGTFAYWQAITDPEALSAIRLTLLCAAFAVLASVVFGLCAAWAVARFRFRGRSLVMTLIDLPFSISPVVAGLLLVLVYGIRGWFGPTLVSMGVPVLFSTPGILLATIFVSFPFVARELIPLMQEQGSEEDEAALLLGASGLQTFLHITLPKIRWGLVYGVILCSARAMGEFGAVSIVSGHIRGRTNTIPLHVEILYSEYKFAAAFAVASLLTFIAVLTLAVKSLAEWRLRRDSDAVPKEALS